MEEFYPSTPGGWSPWSCQTPMACCHVFRPFLCCWMPRSIPPSHDQGRWGSRSGLKLPPSICLLHKKVLGKVSRRWIRKKKQTYFLNSDVQLCNSSIEHHPGPTIFLACFFLDISKSKAFHLCNLHEGIECWVYEAGAPWGFPHLCQ